MQVNLAVYKDGLIKLLSDEIILHFQHHRVKRRGLSTAQFSLDY
jgi:hypothetical protein